MNEAIRIAIESGYTRNGNSYPLEFFTEDPYERFRVVQEPLFWQALGKTLGYGDNNTRAEYYTTNSEQREYEDLAEWEYQAHRYLSVVLTGGDQEAFWKELLTS